MRIDEPCWNCGKIPCEDWQKCERVLEVRVDEKYGYKATHPFVVGERESKFNHDPIFAANVSRDRYFGNIGEFDEDIKNN